MFRPDRPIPVQSGLNEKEEHNMKLYGQHTQEVATRIVEAFRNPEQLPHAIAPIFIRRKDDVPCRRWSWHNQLIVALHGTMDARGIKQWNAAGRKIVAGTKAIWILAPCIKTVDKKSVETDEETKLQVLFGFRSVPVFAVDQTEGDPLPAQDADQDNWIKHLPLIDVAESWDIRVGSYSHHGSAPLGYYQRGGAGEAIMLGVENLSTWAHELIHSADQRLGSLKEAKWHREIVAELGGAVLLECLGLQHDADLGGAYQYIEAYAMEAKKDVVRACIEVLDRVCNCVKLIMDTAEAQQQEKALNISGAVA